MTYGASLPDTDPPFYFTRRFSGLMIFGRKVAVTIEEDKPVIARQEQQGYIFTESFSVACVEGELGSQPLAVCVPISREQFEEARRREWRPY